MEDKKSRYEELAHEKVRIKNSNGTIIVESNFLNYDSALKSDDNIFIEIIRSDNRHAYISISVEEAELIADYIVKIKDALK